MGIVKDILFLLQRGVCLVSKFRYLQYIISELPIARRTTTIKGIKQKWKEVKIEVRGKTISLQF